MPKNAYKSWKIDLQPIVKLPENVSEYNNIITETNSNFLQSFMIPLGLGNLFSTQGTFWTELRIFPRQMSSMQHIDLHYRTR